MCRAAGEAEARHQKRQTVAIGAAYRGGLLAAAHDPVQARSRRQAGETQHLSLDRQVVAKGPSTGLTYAYALFDLGHALRVSGHPDQAIPILEQRMKIDNQRDVVKAELEQAKKDAKGKG